MSAEATPEGAFAPTKPSPSPLLSALDALGSLKFTVVLFALSMVLVLAGTLAQTEQDMWEVLAKYFKSYFVLFDMKIFFPRAFFGGFTDTAVFRAIAPLRIPFVGGATLGLALSLNLFSAHVRRFKVQGAGHRLWVGVGLMLLGCLLAVAVILSGNFKDGLQTEPFVSYATLWWFYKVALIGLLAAMLYAFVVLPKERRIEQIMLFSGSLPLTVFLVWLFYSNWTMADEGMRILWQLTQGLGAGVVMLLGSLLVFKRRAGIVVLHLGVAVLMIGVVVATFYSVEERMTLYEGDTASYARDIRTAELAIIDTSDAKVDQVVVVPLDLLIQNEGKKLSDKQLPFDVRLDKHFPNAVLEPLKAGDEPVATAGAGLKEAAVGRRQSAGVDTDSAVDLPAAYVTFLDPSSGDAINTHLVSIYQSVGEQPELVEIGDKKYEVYLRFKRTYRPFSLTLVDVRKDDYVGTTTPRNYSSDLRLVDPEQGEDRTVHIKMNDPLRYANLTFYQSGYTDHGGIESTDLQVVRNVGWMIPYVACSIVSVGMFWHFLLTLLRYLKQQNLAMVNAAKPVWGAWLAGGLVVLLTVGMFMSRGRSGLQRDGFDFQAAGRIPVMYEGRVKPLDSLARNTMRVISNRATVKSADGEREPAVRWLIELAASDPAFHAGKEGEEGDEEESDEIESLAQTAPVFRIDNLEVLDLLGLERRKGYRYSWSELKDQLPALDKAAEEASKVDKLERSVYQNKLLLTRRRLYAYRLLEVAFGVSTMPQLTKELLEGPRGREAFNLVLSEMGRVRRFEPPLTVPTGFGEIGMDEWQPYSSARMFDNVLVAAGKPADQATEALTDILQAYADKDADRFNSHVSTYLAQLEEDGPEEFNSEKIKVESMLNMYSPFGICMALYVIAFLLGVSAWATGNSPALRSLSNALVVGSLLVHTFALVARIYVSGRPPVTNLYSSAVFIGWGAAALAMVLELISPFGIGNIAAAFAGFSTLVIAGGLEADGDTMSVLQAVLDTTFWLTTHVVCITVGYLTTFLAGVLGIAYVAVGMFTNVGKSERNNLAKTIYGMVCFAMFFSFLGTVLGGLWADDSWGRFWGWDPKENGALLIVLWNALVLHARWGGMIRSRGMAVLAIFGNIVTAWSWFGTNQLGVGLHSYGFTSGAAMWLWIFVFSQIAVIGMGCVPTSRWLSYQTEP
ncbi:MAG: cytochrome c biogenesis protein CcsA [Planctomycetales bacterium]|nr:cytochrome c biogenesis protein CcsA [Planctomycetales bacterium]